MFKVGDYIAHPMHGAGKIEDIVTKKICGTERDYFVLKLPVGAMRVLVPIDGCENIGVRSIIPPDKAESLIMEFAELDVSMTRNWNKRYRDNMMKIKSGDLTALAEVVKGLMCRDSERGLSTGERKMLNSAKQILISELVISLGQSFEEIEGRLLSVVT